VIPAELRRALDLHAGDDLVAWVEDDRLVLRRRKDVERELRGMLRGLDSSLSEELIGERRREAARER
jgi:AbrB family looped-hinge helix DNA binding protein